MAILYKYSYTVPPSNWQRGEWVPQELRKIERSIGSIVQLTQAVQTPIEVGAVDSGGTGYRILRIPN